MKRPSNNGRKNVNTFFCRKGIVVNNTHRRLHKQWQVGITQRLYCWPAHYSNKNQSDTFTGVFAVVGDSHVSPLPKYSPLAMYTR